MFIRHNSKSGSDGNVSAMNFGRRVALRPTSSAIRNLNALG